MKKMLMMILNDFDSDFDKKLKKKGYELVQEYIELCEGHEEFDINAAKTMLKKCIVSMMKDYWISDIALHSGFRK